MIPDGAALLIIDVQRAIDDPRWAADGPRNNPGAEANMAAVLAAWRDRGWPVVHIRHDSTVPGSTYTPGTPGHGFKDAVMPRAGETVMGKATNSAFIGTGLEPWLRGRGIGAVVVMGVITNNSVEATVRTAGNLGFTVWLVEDACFTFARRDRRGHLWTAEDVHALSLANMDGEYAAIATTRQIA
ncbi:nicotinamidase-related amidase [Azospirillum fermentarium]|uniref:cysteine hydrolase family protein n=1 Tax=Azospirillum fermentarium TaxID=1233114 RepID=UPI002225CBFF|nr:cysteine hydrolase family protein [Azospirillum fermentarium]MCW2246792.1 nicotinamidase-related amidase [Azospirillum fermentarium]